MPTDPDFAKMLASADQHKEAGYQMVSQYMDSNMRTSFSHEIRDILGLSMALSDGGDPLAATIGQLAMVALVDYMERFETERMNDATE